MGDAEETVAAPVLSAKLRRPAPRGMARPRLIHTLDRVWSCGLGLVVAPAGSGKTTLLSQFAAAHDGSVAWYQAEASEASPLDLLAHIHRALTDASAVTGPPWSSVDAAIDHIDRALRRPLVLIIDDVHTLLGTAAEAALSRFIAYLPSPLGVVLGSRRPPSVDLSRRRLDDQVVELAANDLRFRTWETEQLFNEEYRERLTPEELAELTWRTEGWVAGLQFFHLATRAKPAAERVRVLAGLGRRSGMVHDYLARNVLTELPEELARFMVRTSPLGWMTGPVCDAFLGGVGSERLLGAAEERRVFTERVDGGAYRYHEVIRAHLEDALVELLGERGAREEHQRAAVLLEDAGRRVEAARAWSRAGDWDAATRLLGDDGDTAVPLPAALTSEPWALLAAARRLVRHGRLVEAVDAYQVAERAYGRAARAEVCRRERAATAAWCASAPSPGDGWSSVLRRATMRHPRRVLDESTLAGDAGDRVTAGMVWLLAGDVVAARARFEAVAQDPQTATLLAAASQLGGVLASLIAGDPVEGAGWAVEALEAEVPWVAHLGAALALAGATAAVDEAAAVRAGCARDGNRWGEAIAALLEGMLWLRLPPGAETPAPGAALDRGVALFAGAGAAVLHAWALGVRAQILASGGDTEAAEASAQALRAGAAAGTDLVRLHIAGRAAVADPGPATPVSVHPPVSVRCFGGLAIAVDGQPVDETLAKPRVRSLLRMLAANAGRTVHREQLIDALWPEQSPTGATRSMQVAVSLARQLLPGGSELIARTGDGYLLALPPGSRADVREFGLAMSRGRHALRAGAMEEARDEFTAALDLYTGELLPEEGAATWAVKERDRHNADAADAAGSLADALLALGDERAAMGALERAVRIDPYRDGVWRMLIATARDLGDVAAARHARRAYEAVLAELDVSIDTTGLDGD